MIVSPIVVCIRFTAELSPVTACHVLETPEGMHLVR